MTYIPSTEEQKILNEAGSVINPATEESIILLKRIVKLLEPGAVVDSANRQRTAVENSVTVVQSTAASLAATVSIAASQTLNAVTTVSTVTNQTGFGGVDGRFQFMELARISYSNGIRSRLSFS